MHKAALCLTLLLSPAAVSLAQNQPLTDAQVDQRVNALLQQMTVDEKIGQLSQEFVFDRTIPGQSTPEEFRQKLAHGELGSLLFVTDPEKINRWQHIAVEQSRLHIPLIFGYDVIHGFRTIFPSPIAAAASWDPAQVEKNQTVAASEASAVGINWAFAPMIDIARDPRWGRIVEGAGEDPYLGAKMAVAQVHGFQGPYIGSPDHILACMKHFAGYGAAEGGRDYEESNISDAQLYNIYLEPFRAAVKAGVGSAMSAYMDLNGVPASGNHWLLHDVLRTDWGFKGFVVSDADAVKNLQTHGYAKDVSDAAVKGLTAGVDMEMSIGPTAYSRSLKQALADGRVTMAEIETADRNILTAKVRLGLFEHPYADVARSKTVLDTPEHRTAARIAAEKSAVLLRNENSLLPLKGGSLKSIAVIGPLADSKVDTLGSWAFQENLDETVTVLGGLQAKLGAARVRYTPGVQLPQRGTPSPFDDLFHKKFVERWSPDRATQELKKALELAQSSDVTVVVAGEVQDMSGESASRESLSLPGGQEELIEAVVATGKPVVVVMINGRPLDLRWPSQHVPAILEAWYPGTQGGAAVANLLMGDAVPGGKLPITWPRNEGQIPMHYDHYTTQAPQNAGKRYWDETSTPLYPFGYGLSYSTFAVSNLHISSDKIPTTGSLQVTADVENTGSIAADEVVQLYIHQQWGSSSRPVRQLKGFERVTLQPHEKKTVTFTLGPDELRYWSAATRGWVNEASNFDVWVGTDSTASLHASFMVK
jgi:beta-glucosidase